MSAFDKHKQICFPDRDANYARLRRLLLDLDPNGGTDPLGMFPLFLKKTDDVLAAHLCAMFRLTVD